MGNILGGSSRRRRRQSTQQQQQQQRQVPKPVVDPWSPFRLKGHVSRGEIAAHVEGSEEPSDKRDTECMICYLFFETSELNVTTCCKHLLCTDCFMQMKPEGYNQKIPCPYCTRDVYGVRVFDASGSSSPSSKSKKISPLKGYDKEEERLVKDMKSMLENVASSPPATFAGMEKYEKCQKEMMKEADERSAKIQSSVIPPQQRDRADEIRDSIVRLLMTPPSSGSNMSNSNGGSALSRMFGAPTPTRRITAADLARTEELLLLRALHMSLEESRSKEKREKEELDAAIAASSSAPKTDDVSEVASKGRCESGVDDISSNSTTTTTSVKNIVSSSSSNQTLSSAAPSSTLPSSSDE